MRLTFFSMFCSFSICWMSLSCSWAFLRRNYSTWAFLARFYSYLSRCFILSFYYLSILLWSQISCLVSFSNDLMLLNYSVASFFYFYSCRQVQQTSKWSMISMFFIPSTFTPSSTNFFASPPNLVYNFTKSLWSPSNHFPFPRLIFTILPFSSSISFFSESIRSYWLPVWLAWSSKTSSSSSYTSLISFSTLGPLFRCKESTKVSIQAVRVYSVLLSLSKAYIFYYLMVSMRCYNSSRAYILMDPSATFCFRRVTSYSTSRSSSKV